MTLNKVDLPQPDGPITARNSPGLTLSETRSIASSGPSGVSNCLTMSSTTRMPASDGSRAPSAVRLFMLDRVAIKDLQGFNAPLYFPPACDPLAGGGHPDARCVTPPASRAPYPGSIRTSTTATSPFSTAAIAWANDGVSSSCLVIGPKPRAP